MSKVFTYIPPSKKAKEIDTSKFAHIDHKHQEYLTQSQLEEIKPQLKGEQGLSGERGSKGDIGSPGIPGSNGIDGFPTEEQWNELITRVIALEEINANKEDIIEAN